MPDTRQEGRGYIGSHSLFDAMIPAFALRLAIFGPLIILGPSDAGCWSKEFAAAILDPDKKACVVTWPPSHQELFELHFLGFLLPSPLDIPTLSKAFHRVPQWNYQSSPASTIMLST